MMSDAELIEQERRALALQEQQAAANNTNMDAQAIQIREQERSMIYDQLNLGEELDIIENLLRSKMLKELPNGDRDWVLPEDPEMIILSEHGVHLIMNTITFYLNKNTLLSNYEEELIYKKMEDFSTALADTIFMEYEKVFKYPTDGECEQKLIQRLKKKQEDIRFACGLKEKDYNERKIWEQLIKEIDPITEKTKIREQIIKNKLKRFEILIRAVQDAVHSTYLRAWKGQERRTLRQHIHVNEMSGYAPQPQQKQPMKLNPFRFRG